jgi:hypothetical protein
VSRYISRFAARVCNLAVIDHCYSLANEINIPYMLGWVVEIDFIFQLRNCAESKKSIRIFRMANEDEK